MKHSIKELYKIKGDVDHIYSAEAVTFVNHARNRNVANDGDCYPMICRVNQGRPFRIYHSIGNPRDFTLGWQYGEKTWFDTQEELIAYRMQAEIERQARKIERLQRLIAESQAELEKMGV